MNARAVRVIKLFRRSMVNYNTRTLINLFKNFNLDLIHVDQENLFDSKPSIGIFEIKTYEFDTVLLRV